MDKLHTAIERELLQYAKHMSLDAAAHKVKANRLGRVDFAVDEVVNKLKGGL